MILRFKVSNFHSIGEDPIELVMHSEKYKEVPNTATSVGIHGLNASGKTNILAAILWLSASVQDSPEWTDGGIPIEPYYFANDKSTKFEIDMLIDGVKFAYQLEVTQEKIIHESLHHYPTM